MSNGDEDGIPVAFLVEAVGAVGEFDSEVERFSAYFERAQLFFMATEISQFIGSKDVLVPERSCRAGLTLSSQL